MAHRYDNRCVTQAACAGPTTEAITQLAEANASVSCRARPDNPSATAPTDVIARMEPAKPRMADPIMKTTMFGARALVSAPRPV